MRSSRAFPLLSLSAATAEWRAGVSPTCLATVRLLDRVDFAVHPGECVVVRHADPAGVRVLLAALAGQAQLLDRPEWQGQRRAAPAVQVRRASIRRDLAAVVTSSWHRTPFAWNASADSASAASRTPARVPVVHLLRATRAPHHAPAHDHGCWERWAATQRALGGAIVLVTDADERDPATSTRSTARLHEPVAASAWQASPVRHCWLRHGRLFDASMPPP